MEKAQIGKAEFFTLFLMSIVANDKISGIFGHELKQDKLIAMFICVPLSLLVFTMYWLTFKNCKFKGFSETIEFLVGKIFSKIIFFLYILYFLFIASLDTRDIMVFIHDFLIELTPMWFITLSFILMIYYSLVNGIEVIARVAQNLFNIVFGIFVVFILLALAVNQLDLYCFFPFLADGFKPLLKPIYMMTFSIPFGEFFIVMVIFQHMKDKKKSLKIGILAQLGAAFMMIIVFITNLLILPPETLQFMTSPALRASKMIDVQDFFQRLDVIVILVLFILSYIKTILLIYGAKEMIISIKKIKNVNLIYFILCIIVYFFSLFYYPDYALLIKTSMAVVMPIINPIFEFGIPFILFILSFIKKGKLKNELEHNGDSSNEENKQTKKDQNNNETDKKKVITDAILEQIKSKLNLNKKQNEKS